MGVLWITLILVALAIIAVAGMFLAIGDDPFEPKVLKRRFLDPMPGRG